MKISAMTLIGITTFLLFFVTILVALDFSFSWVFYLTCIGQVMVVIMVYRVLRDPYTTNKTFEDFYQDRPMPKEEKQDSHL